MDTKTFIEKFADAVEIENPASLDENTPFRTLDEWSSLVALSLIAMVDEEYDVRIKGDDIRSSETIEDLFDLVKSRR